jgi:hypothetical protein
MVNASKVHDDLRDALHTIDLVKDFGLSEREIDTIVKEAAKDKRVYNAVQDHIECPSDENKCDAYNNIVNAKLAGITVDLANNKL